MTNSSDDPGVDPVESHLGAKIRRLRESVGWTSAELGAAVGVTGQQIEGYEAASDPIDAYLLFLVAQKLDVPVEALFEGLEEPKPTSLIRWEQIDPAIRKAAMNCASEQNAA